MIQRSVLLSSGRAFQFWLLQPLLSAASNQMHRTNHDAAGLLLLARLCPEFSSTSLSVSDVPAGLILDDAGGSVVWAGLRYLMMLEQVALLSGLDSDT